MPEIHFQIQWPDGSQDTCYSPSLVVKKYFSPGAKYPLNDFVERAQTALNIASDRVQEKYGFPCSRALGQLQMIENRAAQFTDVEAAQVSLIQFLE